MYVRKKVFPVFNKLTIVFCMLMIGVEVDCKKIMLTKRRYSVSRRSY